MERATYLLARTRNEMLNPAIERMMKTGTCKLAIAANCALSLLIAGLIFVGMQS